MRDRELIESDRRDDSGMVQPPDRMLFLVIEVLLDIRQALLEQNNA